MELNVSVEFIDTNNEVSFNLENHTVFFGLNGRGKTRILEVIRLLAKLAVSPNTPDINEQIDKLNLSKLKINNVSYDDIFRTREDALTKRRTKMIRRYNNHSFLVKYVLEIYINIYENSQDYLSPLILRV